MTPTQRAYLAGFIDGEGCISIHVNGWNRSGTGDPRRWGTANGSTNVRLYVGVCDEAVMRWIVKVVGFGTVTERGPSPARPSRWRNVWMVTWTGKRAAGILRALLPYLHVKRRQAELLIEWVALAERTRHFKGRNGGAAYAPDVIARRDAIIAEVRSLNRRGQLPSESQNELRS